MIEEDSRPIDPNLQRMIEDLRKRDGGISEKVLDIFRVVDRKFFNPNGTMKGKYRRCLQTWAAIDVFLCFLDFHVFALVHMYVRRFHVSFVFIGFHWFSFFFIHFH